MTSASQAGILHGNNDGIPAFRWYERDREQLMVSSNPEDAAEIVRRAVERRGPAVEQRRQHLQPGDRRCDARVHHDGGDQGQGSRASATAGRSLGFFFSPTGYLRSFTLFLGEFIKEMSRRAGPAARGSMPQMHRGLQVRRHARRQQRPAARRQHLADHRGDVPRRRTSSTPTSPTTTSSPTTAGPSGSSRSRPSTASTRPSRR